MIGGAPSGIGPRADAFDRAKRINSPSQADQGRRMHLPRPKRQHEGEPNAPGGVFAPFMGKSAPGKTAASCQDMQALGV